MFLKELELLLPVASALEQLADSAQAVSAETSGCDDEPSPNLTGATATLDLGGGVTMELVRIPSGTFMMGTDSTDDSWQEHSRPVHSVTISRNFYIGRYEVTQDQWQAVMGDNPSNFSGCDDCPVETVSWEDAVEFCQVLSASTGYGIRLPNEAEWEYACLSVGACNPATQRRLRRHRTTP